MKSRSLFGPLMLIAIGVLFLLRNFYADLSLVYLFAHHWPWILIFWGAFRVLEYFTAVILRRPAPRPLGGGAILLAILLVLAGSLAYELEQRRVRFPDWTGDFIGLFGHEFTFPMDQIQRTTAETTVMVVIRDVKGRVRVVGSDAEELTISGKKRVRARTRELARLEVDQVALEVSEEGPHLILRTSSRHDQEARKNVSLDIEVQVPRRLAVAVENAPLAQLDIQRISNGVTVDGPSRSVVLKQVAGAVRIRGSRGRLVQAERLAGSFDLEGSARKVHLEDIAGTVNLKGGRFTSIRLARLSRAVTIESKDREFHLGSLPGSADIRRRSVSIADVVGPVRLISRRSMELRLERVSGEAEIEGQRADLDVQIDPSSIESLKATVKRGNIEVYFQRSAVFTVDALTRSGRATHEFGKAIETLKRGRSVTLRGSTGEGPSIRLVTGRGDISLRRQRRKRGPERRAETQIMLKSGGLCPATPLSWA